jgi:hypothetical protein
MSESEAGLTERISETLESHGYLPRVRAGLKVIALKNARILAEKGSIPQTDAIRPKRFDDQNDAIQIELCKEFFQKLGLEHAAQMLELEAESAQVNLKSTFPGIKQDSDIPVLVSLVQRVSAK